MFHLVTGLYFIDHCFFIGHLGCFSLSLPLRTAVTYYSEQVSSLAMEHLWTPSLQLDNLVISRFLGPSLARQKPKVSVSQTPLGCGCSWGHRFGFNQGHLDLVGQRCREVATLGGVDGLARVVEATYGFQGLQSKSICVQPPCRAVLATTFQ